MFFLYCLGSTPDESRALNEDATCARNAGQRRAQESRDALTRGEGGVEGNCLTQLLHAKSRGHTVNMHASRNLQVPELRGKLAELEASADSGGKSAMSVGLAAIEVD